MWVVEALFGSSKFPTDLLSVIQLVKDALRVLH